MLRRCFGCLFCQTTEDGSNKAGHQNHTMNETGPNTVPMNPIANQVMMPSAGMMSGPGYGIPPPQSPFQQSTSLPAPPGESMDVCVHSCTTLWQIYRPYQCHQFFFLRISLLWNIKRLISFNFTSYITFVRQSIAQLTKA